MKQPRKNELSNWLRSNKVLSVTGLVVAAVIGAVWLFQIEPSFSPPSEKARPDAPVAEAGDPVAADRPEPAVNRGSRVSHQVVDNGPAPEPGNQIRYRIGEAGYVDAYVAASAPRRGINLDFQSGTGEPWNPGSSSEASGEEGVEAGTEADLDSDSADAEAAPEEIPRNERIEGRVIDEYGMPVPGIGLISTAARLFSVPHGAPVAKEDFLREAVSGASGRFVFQELVAGDYEIRTLPAAGYASAQTTVRAGSGTVNLVVKGQRDIRLVGQVASVDGQPLAGALVAPKVIGAAGAYTDGYGRFDLLLPLRHGTGFQVRAQADGFKEAVILVSEHETGDTIPLDITLQPVKTTVPVVGGVTDHAAAPVAGKRVTMTSAAAGQRYTTVTDGRGDFVFFDVEIADDYQLQIFADRYHHEYLQRGLKVDANGLNLTVGLQARETGTLSGQITDLSGSPIPNFVMELTSRDQVGRGISVSADGAGNYVVPNAPAGDLVLETRSVPRFVVSGIRMSPGAEVRAPVVLDWGRDNLHGQVIDSQGNGVPGESVAMTWAFAANGINSWSSRQTVTDSQGFFRFERLGPGERMIMVSASGFKPARVHHDIASDGSDLLMRLERREITVGMVSD